MSADSAAVDLDFDRAVTNRARIVHDDSDTPAGSNWRRAIPCDSALRAIWCSGRTTRSLRCWRSDDCYLFRSRPDEGRVACAGEMVSVGP